MTSTGPVAVIGQMIDILPQYGGAPRAAARDPYLRARWEAASEHERRAALLEITVAVRRPVRVSWRAGARYARRLQRHAARHRDAAPDRLRAHMPVPPSPRTGLAAALFLVAALERAPRTPPRTPPPQLLAQVLYLAVLGALITVLARGVAR